MNSDLFIIYTHSYYYKQLLIDILNRYTYYIGPLITATIN